MAFLLSLKNISAAGVIVIMLTIMIIFGGLGFLFLSSLTIGQNNFFDVFNQSVVENRKRLAEDIQFRDLQLQDIQRSQNNTRDLLPPLTQSFEEIHIIDDKLDMIINLLNSTN